MLLGTLGGDLGSHDIYRCEDDSNSVASCGDRIMTLRDGLLDWRLYMVVIYLQYLHTGWFAS